MFYSIDGSLVTLRIKAQPAASKNEFCEIYGNEAIKVRIKAPAVEGAANKELVKFLSKQFKIPKSDIDFKSGETSKIKVLEFPLTKQFEAWVSDDEYVGVDLCVCPHHNDIQIKNKVNNGKRESLQSPCATAGHIEQKSKRTH